MHKKLTITRELEIAYQEMAMDVEREKDATYWTDSILVDAGLA